MKLYKTDSDTMCKNADSLKCGGCNNIASDYYGVSESKKKAIQQFDKPEEGYGRGLCSFCMCEFLWEEKSEIEL